MPVLSKKLHLFMYSIFKNVLLKMNTRHFSLIVCKMLILFLTKLSLTLPIENGLHVNYEEKRVS